MKKILRCQNEGKNNGNRESSSFQREAVHTLSFFTIGIFLFLLIQMTLTPQWNYPHFVEETANTFQEFYAMPAECNIQAFFLGPSYSAYGVNPMLIYEKTGICSFNLSSSFQYIVESQYLLTDVLDRYNPSLIFCEAGSLFRSVFDESCDISYRYILENMPMSRNKIDFARCYAENFRLDERCGRFLSAFFPVYFYHDRWKELKKSDFSYPVSYDYYTKGYNYFSRIEPSTANVEWMNDIAASNAEAHRWKRTYENGEWRTEEFFQSLYEANIPERNQRCLKEMREQCETHGAKLIVYKVPDLGFPQFYSSSWTRIRHDSVESLCESLEIPFLDLMYDVDLGVDWSRDTVDGGWHLNYFGAEKVTNCLVEYLSNYCAAASGDAFYDSDLATYRSMRDLVLLQNQETLTDYIASLSSLEDCAVFITVNDDFRRNISEWDFELLRSLGLQTDFAALEYSDAYSAVIERGRVIYEASSNAATSYSGRLEDGTEYTIASAGWLQGAVSAIEINGIDYSLNLRGLNFVVYSIPASLTLDSVTFDTWDSPNPPAARDYNKENDYFRKYELLLMTGMRN